MWRRQAAHRNPPCGLPGIDVRDDSFHLASLPHQLSISFHCINALTKKTNIRLEAYGGTPKACKRRFTRPREGSIGAFFLSFGPLHEKILRSELALLFSVGKSSIDLTTVLWVEQSTPFFMDQSCKLHPLWYVRQATKTESSAANQNLCAGIWRSRLAGRWGEYVYGGG
jgi:hypothetical protein